ncbi:hypothetical protein PCLA_01r0348 [Pseudomonas citronellolis]|nr:hypothetical protein PCLA_01r0348 [Pseudomonas citronellolis]
MAAAPGCGSPPGNAGRGGRARQSRTLLAWGTYGPRGLSFVRCHYLGARK